MAQAAAAALVALGEALTAAGPYLAAALASTALSVAISLLTAPNLKGPRQKDPGFQTSEYGTPLGRTYGPRNRKAGSCIWYSGQREVRQRESGSGGSQQTFAYYASAAFALADARPGRDYISIGRIWFYGKLVYDGASIIEGGIFDAQGRVGQPFASIAFYPGTRTQMPDPTIEAALGVGNVSAYRDTCYVVLKDIVLADYGNRIPNIEFELIADDEISVIEVIEDIAAMAQVPIDTSLLELNTGAVAGYDINQDVSPAECLAPLCAAYSFLVAEAPDGLKCVPLGMKARAEIPLEDLGATAGTPTGQTIEWERTPDSEIPQEVTLNFIDFGRDMQNNSVRARYEGGSYRANRSITVAVTMDPAQALDVAHQFLWSMRLSALSAKTTVSEKWMRALPGDNLLLPSDRGLLPMRLNRWNRGADGVIAWELALDDSEVYPKTTLLTSDHEPGTPPTDTPGDTFLMLLDIPFLRVAHDDTGLYGVMTGTSPTWPGGQAYRSTDGGTDYDAMTSVLGGGTIGDVSTATPSGPTLLWDRATTIRVTLKDETKELDSISELSVYNGGNVAYIGPASGVGGEIFQFRTATLVSTGVYDLTNLLRGRRGTEWAVGGHAADEIFVLLTDSSNLFRKDFGAGDWDSDRLYKGVTPGQLLSAVTEQTFRNTGEAKRPFSPCHFIGRRGSGGDLSVSWIRRTRQFVGSIGLPAPLGEEDETYRLELYRPADAWVSGASYTVGDRVREQSYKDYGWQWYVCILNHTAGAVGRPNRHGEAWRTYWAHEDSLRTVNLQDQAFYDYSASDQTDDGLTPGDPVQMQVRQRSSIRGFGHPELAAA